MLGVPDGTPWITAEPPAVASGGDTSVASVARDLGFRDKSL